MVWKKNNSFWAYVQKLNLKNSREWRLYCTNELKGFKKKPQDIPSIPDQTYKEDKIINLYKEIKQFSLN